MDRGGGRTSSASKPSLFAVYQNPALSAALTSNSLRPSASTFLFILSLSSAAGLALLFSLSRENAFATNLGLGFLSQDVARICSKVIPTVASIILLGTFLALFRALSQWRTRNATDVLLVSPSKGTKELTRLTNRQLNLLGLKSKLELDSDESSKKPNKPKTSSSPSPSSLLVPLHQSITGSDHLSSGGTKMHSFSTPSRSPASPSMYLVGPTTSTRSPVPLQWHDQKASPGADQSMASPWSNKRRPAFHKEIATEAGLERFLADVDEKISETASKLSTPPLNRNGFGGTSPNALVSSVSTSGTTRSTPLRPVRMSPGSQKFTTPPKKGEVDLPRPMSMEETVEAFEKLGIYPDIEQWRDCLRQWFASVLLNPILEKIETSHLKVMETAAKLNISITLNQVGSDTPSTPTANVSQERANEWKPSFTVDEDGPLHQLRASLVQVLDASKLPTSNFQQYSQQAASIPVLQEAVDAIMEHQRLHALMKGEWGKGLLPQSSVRADYTVQRIRKLAEGTCLKNYEYLRNGQAYDKVDKKWSLELPSDSHLLLYLFCAFLEYPKWMLHVDPVTYAGAQAIKNPLFLGVLPPKESFPEKYIAVISGVPSVLHPGACILAVGKQSPPVFALYWDKKPQFSFQVSYGGIVRGMHLGSSALAILPVLEQETDD
ncbi:transmembrane protein 209 [Phtheirospermum japonicum]|uniref:Transmembrane protein 209 n=1 Tax=Phtheirospermum japonicum TaxID=374723 RepID=A0A830B6V2_9LAMI|nr:transmembrane protein 209 [Phtheirospermum japonicum]